VPTLTRSPSFGLFCVGVSVDDETTTSIGTASSTTPESCTQAEVGNDAVLNGKGSGIVSLPAFGSFNFTGGMVNGAALGSVSSKDANYSEGKKNVITTGVLSGGGTAFTTTQGP